MSYTIHAISDVGSLEMRGTLVTHKKKSDEQHLSQTSDSISDSLQALVKLLLQHLQFRCSLCWADGALYALHVHV